ncbi:hypothetical protein F2P47_15685 [Parvibaculum sedimenti]|uniref:Uncharacterized protein n=1 Tax=Parvibaculum sedimenti TaxID=2608632 RepID=A0A6N6VG95_9HYPH|nr:ATP-binding protein [Parvibaculum sedimenti]KAB7738702.1 hypothetical protein F2P47_15685 [Parvibaculum sedimenti]
MDERQIITASIDATRYRVKDILRQESEGAREQILEALGDCIREFPINGDGGRKSCLITGRARTGKTIISTALARSHGFALISLDQLRDIYLQVEDASLRDEMRQLILDELFSRFPEGVIVEGDDLIYVNRDLGNDSSNLSLDFCGSLASRHKIKCFVVGNADAGVDAKVTALRNYQQTGKCWTVKSPRWKDLPARAVELIEDSQRLRAMAPAHDITYIEMNVIDFDLSVKNAAEKIAPTPA